MTYATNSLRIPPVGSKSLFENPLHMFMGTVTSPPIIFENSQRTSNPCCEEIDVNNARF